MATNVRVLNTLTGKIADIPEKFYLSDVFNPGHLVLVGPDEKPYVGAYTPKTADEFEAAHPAKVVAKKSPEKNEETD